MKPAKEKAKELVDKFYLIPELNGSCIITKHSAKQCAIIAINEMLEFTKQTVVSSLTICTEEGYFREETTHYDSYLVDVKQEIENL
jgi:hypothetical protein